MIAARRQIALRTGCVHFSIFCVHFCFSSRDGTVSALWMCLKVQFQVSQKIPVLGEHSSLLFEAFWGSPIFVLAEEEQVCWPNHAGKSNNGPSALVDNEQNRRGSCRSNVYSPNIRPRSARPTASTSCPRWDLP